MVRSWGKIGGNQLSTWKVWFFTEFTWEFDTKWTLMLCKNTTKYNTFMRKRQLLTNMPFSGSWHSRNSAKNGKMCQNMFLSTIEGTLAEFDVTQRENDTRRPDRHRCDPVVGSMSRKAWRTNDAYNAELLRTCLASFFKQAENVRKRWKKKLYRASRCHTVDSMN